jgi:hypothetical protein
VRVVARHDPTPKHAMKAFTASLKEIEDLRNMWEHEIDYLYGRRKCRDRWTRKLDPAVSVLQAATSGTILHLENGEPHSGAPSCPR